MFGLAARAAVGESRQRAALRLQAALLHALRRRERHEVARHRLIRLLVHAGCHRLGCPPSSLGGGGEGGGGEAQRLGGLSDAAWLRRLSGQAAAGLGDLKRELDAWNDAYSLCLQVRVSLFPFPHTW